MHTSLADNCTCFKQNALNLVNLTMFYSAVHKKRINETWPWFSEIIETEKKGWINKTSFV